MPTTSFRITKGLNVPLAGEPAQSVNDGPKLSSVGIIGDDYIGMKPTMLVQEGDKVSLGQPVFEDKKSPGVIFTSPASGTVANVNRGAKRKFESLVIELEGNKEETFESFADSHLPGLDREKVVDQLVRSGLWTAIRARPFSRVPTIDSTPHSIFVTACDTNPLAADPAVVLKQPDFQGNFVHGLQVISTLTSGTTHLCFSAGADIPGIDESCVVASDFSGPHPSGLVGTHIHFLDPVNSNKTVWHIGYQDVAAIGHLFVTGKLMTERVISLCGPGVKNPRLVKTQLGACIDDLVANDVDDSSESLRFISGSALSGRKSHSPVNFLGRYHQQVTVLQEGNQRQLLGWATPGTKKFSVSKAFASALSKAQQKIPFTTSTEGSVRAVVPIGMYEKVMPLDLVITPLVKSLLVQDTETASTLGCLELDEEDLALCTFVCPGKNEYGPLTKTKLNPY